MGHVALLTAANKVLGKLRCSLQALKSASEGSDDPEQASAVAILELKIAELEAKRQLLIPSEVRLKAHVKTMQTLMQRRKQVLLLADEAVADVTSKSLALTNSIGCYGDVTNALAALEDDIGKSRGLADAENDAIMHRESTRLTEKQAAMAVLSQDIAALTAAGEPMGKFVDKFAELSVLAAEVDALQKLPPRIGGENPDDLAASIAAGRIHDMAVKLLGEACHLQKNAAQLSWKHAQDKRQQALESLPKFIEDEVAPLVQCDFDGKVMNGKVDLTGTDYTLLIVGMKVCCGDKIGEVKVIAQAAQAEPQGDGEDTMAVDTGKKRHGDDTADDDPAPSAKRVVLGTIPPKASPPTVRLGRAIGQVVDAAAAAAAQEAQVVGAMRLPREPFLNSRRPRWLKTSLRRRPARHHRRTWQALLTHHLFRRMGSPRPRPQCR
jgi:hypothetical protein